VQRTPVILVPLLSIVLLWPLAVVRGGEPQLPAPAAGQLTLAGPTPSSRLSIPPVTLRCILDRLYARLSEKRPVVSDIDGYQYLSTGPAASDGAGAGRTGGEIGTAVGRAGRGQSSTERRDPIGQECPGVRGTVHRWQRATDQRAAPDTADATPLRVSVLRC
jgi:hypothetical protein